MDYEKDVQIPFASPNVSEAHYTACWLPSIPVSFPLLLWSQIPCSQWKKARQISVFIVPIQVCQPMCNFHKKKKLSEFFWDVPMNSLWKRTNEFTLEKNSSVDEFTLDRENSPFDESTLDKNSSVDEFTQSRIHRLMNSLSQEFVGWWIHSGQEFIGWWIHSGQEFIGWWIHSVEDSSVDESTLDENSSVDESTIIYRFLRSTMIWVILDHWSSSRASQTNTTVLKFTIKSCTKHTDVISNNS